MKLCLYSHHQNVHILVSKLYIDPEDNLLKVEIRFMYSMEKYPPLE